jgi:hypothetical protein
VVCHEVAEHDKAPRCLSLPHLSPPPLSLPHLCQVAEHVGVKFMWKEPALNAVLVRTCTCRYVRTCVRVGWLRPSV